MFLLPQNAWEMRKRTYKNSEGKKLNNRGIFATKDIEAGTIIGDYLGLLIPEEEENKYEKDDELYLMYYDEGITVFPDPKKAGIHILNHSCEPNTWMYTYKGHTLYFALRKIFKGEELTVSYQVCPIDEDCEPCVHACFCQTPSCTGTWHMSEEKYDTWREFDDKEAAKTKKAAVPLKQYLSLLDNYPEKIKDNRIYKLFGALGKTPKIINTTTFPTVKAIREEIRTSGRMLKYPKLGIIIRGTEGKDIYLLASK
jgi:hypothetical protein